MNEYSTVIGMDLGDKRHHFCVLNQYAEIEQEGTVTNSRAGLKRVFSGYEPSLIAIETGTHSKWVSSLLEKLGHKVLVANARKLRAIYSNERKCDRLDAEMLARLARSDPKLLSPITHRGDEAQADLSVIRSRDSLVAARTQLINHVRGVVKSHGERVRLASAASFHKVAREVLPGALRPALFPVLEIIEKLTERIKEFDRDIERLCKNKYPETELLRSVSGVGPLTSLCYVLTLETPQRFTKCRNVPAYIGLVPERCQSGNSDPQMRITKCGCPHLRRLLVTSAQYILGVHGPDTELRQWGERLMARGGANARKRAVVAVARKLSVILYRLWGSGTLYDPFPNAPEEDALNSPTEAGPEQTAELTGALVAT